jgi:hypothetical protein
VNKTAKVVLGLGRNLQPNALARGFRSGPGVRNHQVSRSLQSNVHSLGYSTKVCEWGFLLMTERGRPLAEGSADVPGCRCGGEMRLYDARPDREAELRLFKCPTCHHELELMVWKVPEES